jgi:hypothetical protein
LSQDDGIYGDNLAWHRSKDLGSLRWHWDEAYKIYWRDGKFRAERLDNGAQLAADTAAELRE